MQWEWWEKIRCEPAEHAINPESIESIELIKTTIKLFPSPL